MFYFAGLLINILFGILSSFGFSKLLLLALETFPESFTFGEAAVIVEAAVLFVASFVEVFTFTPVSCFDVSTTILQVIRINITMQHACMREPLCTYNYLTND